MLKIKKWAEDKPKHIALIAQHSVILIETAFKLLYAIKKNAPFIQLLDEIPPYSKWLNYYRNHHLIKQYFDTTFLNSDKFFSLFSNYLNTFPEKPTHTTQKIDDKNLKEVYQAGLDVIELEFKGNRPEYSPEQKKGFLQAEFIFLLKVFIPCVFLFREHPTKLYRCARLGDLDALDNLLRIDKAILCDHQISRHIYRASLEKNRSNFERLAKAVEGSLSDRLNPQRTKFILAGFLSVFSEKLGHRLSAPDIQALFNAVAADMGRGEIIDTDLPDSPEAFSSVVSRERTFWEHF
ncbi:MAG: hypothetical protein AMJ61_09140 [Desulfobacterales bacterium SG8_35_2]|nr:MAG: hypothetical protein AMJ61_09140 [Desulfobacterales bacterium SG8_35_2]